MGGFKIHSSSSSLPGPRSLPREDREKSSPSPTAGATRGVSANQLLRWPQHNNNNNDNVNGCTNLSSRPPFSLKRSEAAMSPGGTAGEIKEGSTVIKPSSSAAQPIKKPRISP